MNVTEAIMKKKLAILLSTALLAGCAVGPNYQRPELSIPETYRGPASEDETLAAGLADRPWWEIFGDEALTALIDEALAHNYDLRVASWRVQEYRARAGITRSELYPQVGYDAGWSRGKTSDFVPGSSTPVSFHDVHLGFSWELDLWGRIRRLSEASLADYLATEEARRGIVLSVVSETAEAYFDLRELDARLDIARRTTEAFQGTYDLFSRQYAGGITSELEVSRAEAALANAAATIPDLERQIVAQENRICFLVGRTPGPIRRGAALTEQALQAGVPPGLPSSLVERRPDIREAEEHLVASNANVGAAVASFFPAIRLTGAYGGVSPQLSDLVGAGKTWTVAAGIAGPLFDGFRLSRQHEASVALFEQAKAQYESVVTRSFGEVSTALVAYAKLADAEAQQARSVAAYQEAVRLANIRYAAGLSSYIEVLDAQQQLFPAENTLTRARLARLESLVALYRSLGGGWSPESRQAAR
jgi:multidrug efflux system outer membrane protein